MKRIIFIFGLGLFFLVGSAPRQLFADTTIPSASSSIAPVAKDTLQSQIDTKTKALNVINDQLRQSQTNLDMVQAQRRSLQSTLSLLDTNVKNLNLKIQSDQLNIQTARLQIDELNFDIGDIQSEVQTKQSAIAQLFHELVKRESEDSNLLMVFLKQGSLANGVLEAQTLSDLQGQLVLDIGNLRNLNNTYNKKIKEVSDHQTQIAMHQSNLKNEEAIVEDQKTQRQALLVDTKQKESVYRQQVDELVKQQNQLSDEISQIEDQLRAAFNPNLLPGARPGVLAWPVMMRANGGLGHITQHYGEASSLYRGRPHNGLDIGVPLGTPVYAASDGVVFAVSNNDRSSWRKYQYGKYILLEHANNISTLYAHLSRQVITKGETVTAGQLIGYSGSTGYATGPHLHFGLYWTPSIALRSIPPAAGLVPVGVTINPENYICGNQCPLDGI